LIEYYVKFRIFRDMLKRLFRRYLKTPLIVRIMVGFVAGSLIGGILWLITGVNDRPAMEAVVRFIAPFGSLLINMLKMIVIPVIFFLNRDGRRQPGAPQIRRNRPEGLGLVSDDLNPGRHKLGLRWPWPSIPEQERI
jgi:hypothetical protein